MSSNMISTTVLRQPVETAQCLLIKYTQTLGEAGIEPSAGSVGDSYVNAWAETINCLFKTAAIHRRGPWRTCEAVEYAALEWVNRFTNCCLRNLIGTPRQPRQKQTSTRLWKKLNIWPRN